MSRAVAETSGRLDKIERLASLLKRTPPEEIEIAAAFLTGSPRQGRIGIGGAALRSASAARPCCHASSSTSAMSTRPSANSFRLWPRIERDAGRAFGQLLRAATGDEQDFIVRLLFGELRQGALEGVLVDAVARASAMRGRARFAARRCWPAGCRRWREAPLDRRATRRSLAFVVTAVPAGSADARRFGGRRRRGAALLGEAALEYKLDGARIQVHKVGRRGARVLAGKLRDVTVAVPEVVELVRAAAGARADSRRRGDCAAAGRRAAAVSGHDAAVRPEARRRAAAAGAADHAVCSSTACISTDAPLIDEPLARRVAALDRAGRRPRTSCRGSSPPVRRGGGFRRRGRLAAGHEGVDGQGARRPATPPDAAVRPGSR